MTGWSFDGTEGRVWQTGCGEALTKFQFPRRELREWRNEISNTKPKKSSSQCVDDCKYGVLGFVKLHPQLSQQPTRKLGCPSAES